jgi:hypothetical protein
MIQALGETGSSTRKCAVAGEATAWMELPIPDSELSVIQITDIRTSDHGGGSPPARESGPRSRQRGEKVNGVVMQSRHDVQEHVSCMLAHDLLNKVTAIVGFCELLASDQTDNQREFHLHRLRVTALLIADILNERSCSPAPRSAGQQEFVEKPVEKKAAEKVEPKFYERSGYAKFSCSPLIEEY